MLALATTAIVVYSAAGEVKAARRVGTDRAVLGAYGRALAGLAAVPAGLFAGVVAPHAGYFTAILGAALLVMAFVVGRSIVAHLLAKLRWLRLPRDSKEEVWASLGAIAERYRKERR